MKIMLSIVLIILFGLIGFGIAGFYISRKKFFFSLNSFIDSFKLDINFSSKKLLNIIDECLLSVNDRYMKLLLQNYKKLVIGGFLIDKTALFKDIGILNEQEKESIFQFFCRLGRIDVINQNENLMHFKSACHEYYNNSKDESVKYSSLYTKLGIIFGAFVALIVI